MLFFKGKGVTVLQYEERYKKETKKLNQQIELLHQHIKKLDQMLNHKNIYEYHLKMIDIETVKGSLQIGHLLEGEVQDEIGIHRFFIDEVKIKEIEGTGTLGIGIKEKVKDEKKKAKKVTPEEASKEVKEIYDNLQQLLGVQKVPDFFQKIAVKENVLVKVYERISHEWESSESFDKFYKDIKEKLQKIELPDKTYYKQSIENIDEDICKQLSSQLEEDVKVLLIITFLLHEYLPGYLKQFEFKQIDLQLKPESLEQKLDIQQIIKSIKSGFHLKELPAVLEQLKNSADIFRNAFVLIIQPAAENSQINHFLKDLHQSIVSRTEEMTNKTRFLELKTEEQSFLFSHLLESLETIPKHILLLYLFHYYLCEPNDLST